MDCGWSTFCGTMVKRCRSCHRLTPGRFIVWFRNETTLLVLWQPPHPAGVYTDYKVSIDPPEAEIDPDSIGPDSFEVIWSGPREFTELHIFSSNL